MSEPAMTPIKAAAEPSRETLLALADQQSLTNPKIKPCPHCWTDENITVYTYDSGWRHVECIKCNYFGPGEGSIRHAIKSHNAAQDGGESGR